MELLGRFENFIGVFPCDKLDTINLKNRKFSSVIINTQKSTSDDVGHWVLLTIFTKNETLTRCEVFNSLGGGRTELPTLIHDYIRTLQITVKYSNIQIQSHFSDFCGLFCAGRFLSIIADESLKDFTNHFKLNFLDHNDRRLVKLIFKYIHTLNV